MRFAQRLKKAYVKRYILSNHINRKNFFNSDCVAIFPEIGVIFNRIKKSGNTSILAYLSDVCGNDGSSNTGELKSQVSAVNTMTVSQLRTVLGYKSLVVVRDPYSRTLSAFLDKVAPGVSHLHSNVPGFGDSSANGFKLYLDFLLAGGVRRDRHFWPQVDLLFQPIQYFDCVARLEDLDRDLRSFLKERGVSQNRLANMRKPHVLEQAEQGKITNATRRLEKYYDDASRRVVRQVYQSDFDTLKY